jgi:hypothetical protein
VITATERIPRPMAIDGIVTNDVSARTLVVSRPESASGYQKLSWRTAHQALYRAEQKGGIPLCRPCGLPVWGKAILLSGCLVTI